MPALRNAQASAAAELVQGAVLRSARTTPLMTVDETVEALKRAGKAGYKMPG